MERNTEHTEERDKETVVKEILDRKGKERRRRSEVVEVINRIS